MNTARRCCLLALAVVLGLVGGGSAQAPLAVNAEARAPIYVVEAELHQVDRAALGKLGLDPAEKRSDGLLEPGVPDMLAEILTSKSDATVERLSHPRVMVVEGQPARTNMRASVIVLDKSRTKKVRAPLGLKWKVTTTAVGKDQVELDVEWDWSRLPAAANAAAVPDLSDVQNVKIKFVARTSLGQRVGYLVDSPPGAPNGDDVFLLLIKPTAADAKPQEYQEVEAPRLGSASNSSRRLTASRSTHSGSGIGASTSPK